MKSEGATSCFSFFGKAKEQRVVLAPIRLPDSPRWGQYNIPFVGELGPDGSVSCWADHPQGMECTHHSGLRCWLTEKKPGEVPTSTVHDGSNPEAVASGAEQPKLAISVGAPYHKYPRQQ